MTDARPTVYDGAAIQRLLAHRHPFLLVDRIEIIAPGSRVRGVKRLTSNEWWASAPSASFSFVLVLEALAQTSGALLHGLTDGARDAVGYFMSANHVRFRHEARPGDELQLDVSLRQWKRGICKTRGIATLATGEVVVTAELTTVVRGVS